MSSEVSARVAQLQVLARRYTREAREYAAKVRELVELERLFANDRDGLVVELAVSSRPDPSSPEVRTRSCERLGRATDSGLPAAPGKIYPVRVG